MSSALEYRDYMARAAICEQKAKGAQNENEKLSWLTMADSWRQTAALHTSVFAYLQSIPGASRVVL
jgi:hypothetical protein